MMRVGLVIASALTLGALATSASAQPSVTVNGTQAPGIASTQAATVATVVVSDGPGSTTDWIALFPVGAPDTAYLDWKYLSGTTAPPATGLTTATIQQLLPVTPGNYELRLFASNGYQRLATSPTIAVNASAITLSINGLVPPDVATAVSGSAVSVGVTSAPGNPTDWVALYPAGAADTAFLDWRYLSGTTAPPASGLTSATVSFLAPPTPGTFEIRFFANGGYQRLASVAFSVQPASTQISVNGAAPPAAVNAAAGTVASVAIASAPGNATDWVGLYAVGASNSQFVTWQYLNGTTSVPPAGISEATLAFLLPVAGGNYEFRVFAGNSYQLLVTSSTVTITPPVAEISLNGHPYPDSVSAPAGSLLTASIAGGPANTTDWVGLYATGAADTAFLDWRYLNGTTAPPSTGASSGVVSFVVPVSAGEFEVRLFAANSYQRLVSSGAITVPTPTTQISVNGKLPPDVVSAVSGSTVSVAVTSAPGNPTDWVALAPVGAPSGTYVAWQYLNGLLTPPVEGLTSATLSFPVPLAAGDYEVRLFVNNGSQRLATSTTIVSGAAAVQISLVTPADGASLSGPPIVVEAEASTNNGTIVDVTFYAGTSAIGSAASPPYAVTWSPATGGEYALSAIATNSAGQSATSAPVHVTVGSASGLSISSVSPSAGASAVDSDVEVLATFSADLAADSISTSTFELRGPTNAVIPAYVSYSTGSRTATLQPAQLLSVATTYTATVAGGSAGVRDGAGNTLAADYSWTFTTRGVAQPQISSLSPTSGRAGTTVSILGSGFGSTQGSSVVVVGNRPGIVTSWTDTGIVAAIAPGATSGSVFVRENGVTSNTASITVVAPSIASIAPTSAIAGSSVTITGSAFGSTQASGQVWLGSAAGEVTSWSDTQIVATIAQGSQTGNAQVLQYGVTSNAVPLTVTGGPPRLQYVYPAEGAPRTLVTLYGQGFGSSQGAGVVRLGNAVASVNTWSDTQLQVTVPPSAVSGTVKVRQAAQWSNALAFRVPALGGVASVISPTAVSMMLGEQRSLQALDDSGAEITGATWTSSDTGVVTLSTEEPGLITAVGPGTATVTVGGASADVTVYSGGTFPAGTVIWSNGASTQGGFYIASPNYDGVADVFAVDGYAKINAIAAGGEIAWTNASLQNPLLFPDFQGGAIAYDRDETLHRLDPLTGESTQIFSYTSDEGQQTGYAEPRLHPDGTVFTIDLACGDPTTCSGNSDTETGSWVVGIDPKTGTRKFRVPTQNWTDLTTVTDEAFCQTTSQNSNYYAYPRSWSAIVAADGHYYVSYVGQISTGTVKRSAALPYPVEAYDLWDQLRIDTGAGNFSAALADHAALRAATGEGYNSWDSQLDSALNNGQRTQAINLENQIRLKYRRLCDGEGTTTESLHVLRVGADGSSSDTVLKSWTSTSSTVFTLGTGPLAPWGYIETRTRSGPNNVDSTSGLNILTDVDEGAIVSWVGLESCSQDPPTVVSNNSCVPVNDHHLTRLRNGVLASDVVTGHDGLNPLRLELQLEDGSFAGTQYDNFFNPTTVVTAGTGAIKWTLPGYWPQQVTPGGLVAASANGIVEFDESGAAVRQLPALPQYTSWMQDAYGTANGVVEAIEMPQVPWGTSSAAMPSGNPLSFGTFMSVSQNTLSQLPSWRKTDWGAACSLETAPDPPQLLSGFAEIFEAEKRSTLLNGAPGGGSWLKTNACRAFFAGNAYFSARNITADDVDAFIRGVQLPRDGRLAKMSRFDAGLITQDVLDDAARIPLLADQIRKDHKGTPVCSLFVQSKGTGTKKKYLRRSNGTMAAAQVLDFSGGTPKHMFVNPFPDALTSFFSQGTIVHESLHTLTGLAHQGDGKPFDLDTKVGAPALNSPIKQRPGEHNVTWKLRQVGCADPTK